LKGHEDQLPRDLATKQPPSIGTAHFTEDLLVALRKQGDPLADAAVDEYFTGVDAEHSQLFSHLVRISTRAEDDDEDLLGVGKFIKCVEDWPDWADPELVRRGQRVFGTWGPQLGMALWMASLPADYACAKGAEPLVRTARLTRNAKRRYIETGQMIVDAMTPGSLVPGEQGYRTVRHVRLMHAAVRHVLLHSTEIEGAAAKGLGSWDDALGVPINQEDLLGCLLSFSVVGIESLKRTGVRVSDADAEAYIHAWNVVGHQIGIDASLLPLGWDDAQTVWRMLQQHEYATSEAGRELTAAAIDCMQDLLGSRLLRNVPAAGIRHFLGDETANLLGVPAARASGRVFFAAVQLGDGIVERTLEWFPGTRPLSAWLGIRMLRSFEEFERDGDRPSFEITSELKEAWGM
jgi:hypothetical protein